MKSLDEMFKNEMDAELTEKEVVELEAKLEENKNKFKFFVARSQYLAGYLMMMGHKLVDLKPDRQSEGRNVFVFVNSERLLEDFKLYKENDALIISEPKKSKI
jgi:hypothetical protein